MKLPTAKRKSDGDFITIRFYHPRYESFRIIGGAIKSDGSNSIYCRIERLPLWKKVVNFFHHVLWCLDWLPRDKWSIHEYPPPKEEDVLNFKIDLPKERNSQGTPDSEVSDEKDTGQKKEDQGEVY